MKYCEEYAALLDPYIDGELPAEDTARVREHLQTCGGCRAYVQAALLMRDAFPEVEDTEVPDGFAESVMGAIRSGAAPQRKRRSPWAKVLLPLAACCAIVVLVKSMPVNFTGADTAAVEESSVQTVQDTAQAAQDGSASARISTPEDTEETAETFADQEGTTEAADSGAEAGKTSPQTAPAAGAASPHAYAAPAQEPADAVPEVQEGPMAQDSPAAESQEDTAQDTPAAEGREDAAQDSEDPQAEAQDDNSVAAVTTNQEPSWFATLTLTPQQAGTALEGLPADAPVSSDPDTGGTVYWLTPDQFDALLTQLGDPAYTLEGDGDLARVIVLPE